MPPRTPSVPQAPSSDGPHPPYRRRIPLVTRRLATSGGVKLGVVRLESFSNGAHGDNGVLQVEWGALFI